MATGDAPPTTAPPAARLAVLGSPIAHSKSPLIHAAAYDRLGLDWSYEAVRCEVAELDGYLASRGPEWRGLSLTMPLKEEARRLAAVLDPVAEESGVVNTLLRLAGGAGWAGFNTDVTGLAAAMRAAGLDATTTVVIGSGATAVSAVLAARRLGARHVEVVGRTPASVAALASRFDGSREAQGRPVLRVAGSPLERLGAWPAGAPAGEATLVVATLPGPAGAELPLPASLARVPLFDVAYDPWPSPLAARWRAAGGTAVAGTEMLVEQALVQVRIFHGGDPARPLPDEGAVLAAMRAAVA